MNKQWALERIDSLEDTIKARDAELMKCRIEIVRDLFTISDERDQFGKRETELLTRISRLEKALRKIHKGTCESAILTAQKALAKENV